ncbi:MAG: LysR family transcriptional regulator [Paracoccaceae bacterium]|nr:LysR family transcriptional regulator [Paracoccaceae bacterium]
MIDKLEMFIALANEAHFGRAAEVMGVTQPTLSAAIKSLEAELGVMLVWRGSRYQGLTPEGARVLDWARRIVGDARTLREEMRAAKTGLSGNLRLAVIPTALAMVPRLTAPFLARHPGVRFTVLSRTFAEILAMIENLEVDAGLTYLEDAPLPRVTTVPLYRERYRLIVSGQSPLARRERVRWADLAGVPLCLLTPDMQNRRIVNRHLAEAGVEVQPGLESNSFVTLIAHVESGRFATIMPAQAAELFLAPGGICAIPLVQPEAEHAVGLVAPHRDPLTPVLSALLDEARRIAERGA